MPKTNPERSVAYERNLARRIRDEREARNWTLDNLAERMTAAGCPMDRSAIYRIESGDPPRRITLDEAATFAAVFGQDLSTIVLPAPVVRSREATKLWRRQAVLMQRRQALTDELQKVWAQLAQLVGQGYEDEILAAAIESDIDTPPDLLREVWGALGGSDQARG